MAPPLDTNLIIRYLTNDSPTLAQLAFALFQRVETGAATVRLTEEVLVEAVQVLSSKSLYNRPRAEIRERLVALIALPGVEMLDKDRYLSALDLYASATTLDFVDALLVIYAQEETPAEVISFDQDFDRVPGITRKQPDATGQVV
jgi:predicted nucleic acid-binding protein